MRGNEPAGKWILALETSGDTCGIALLRGEKLISEHTFRHEMRLSEHLIAFTDRLLRDAECEIAEIDLFAVGIGPGSFTGVRIGVMTAKTWAATLNKPIIGINAMETLAADYAGLTDTLIVPLLPCRPGMVFAAAYRIGAEMEAGTETETRWELAEPAAFSIAEAAELARISPASNVIFCGAAARTFRAELSGALAASQQNILPQNIAFGRAEFPRAAQVATLARRRSQSENPADDALTLVPLYIAPPQITAPKVAFAVPAAGEGN